MYFDPGMGSLVIQAIIAIFAVGGGVFSNCQNKDRPSLWQKERRKNGD